MKNIIENIKGFIARRKFNREFINPLKLQEEDKKNEYMFKHYARNIIYGGRTL